MVSNNKVFIIGAGPAAHMAAIYLHTSSLKPFMIREETEETYNFLGYDRVVGVLNVKSHKDLLLLMDEQIKRFGINCSDKKVDSVEFKNDKINITAGDDKYEACALIIDDKTIYERLFKNECSEKLKEKGVFVCGKINSLYSEAIVLIGSGCQAYFEAKEYLETKEYLKQK